MSPEPSTRTRRLRATLLVLLYVLCALLPTAHLLVHDHHGALTAALGEDAPCTADQDCGHGCEHPFHHHHDHEAGACALCLALGKQKTLLAHALARAHQALDRTATVHGHDLAAAAQRATAQPRAPPAAPVTCRPLVIA